jgi:hypothetical protein
MYGYTAYWAQQGLPSVETSRSEQHPLFESALRPNHGDCLLPCHSIRCLKLPLSSVHIRDAAQRARISILMSPSSQAVRYRMVSTKDDDVDTDVNVIDVDGEVNRDEPQSTIKFWAFVDRKR